VSVTSDRPASCSPTPGGTHSERLELTCGLNEDLEVKTPTAPGRWILTIVVRANEAQSVNNVARVTSSDLDPDLSNNEAIVEHDITEVADLSLDKSVATPPFPPFYAGNNVRFQLQVTNSGPSTAENVVLEDMLPEGVTVVNVNPSQGSCTTGEPGSTPLVCNLGTLGVDVSATVFVILNIDPDYVGSLENDAVVSSDLFDPDNGNNRDYVIVPVSTWSNVFMKKGCGWEEDVLAGEEIQYDILVRNDGPSTVHNYEFWDLLPDDVTYLSYEMLPSTGGECFYTPQLPPMHGGPGQGLHCLLGDIAPSETRVVYLRVLVNADAPEGPLTNEITDWDADSNVYLTGYGDDLYCSNYVINEADLSIRKTADPYKVYAGEQIQYDVSVTNNGPGIAFNVLVTDTFDPGVEYEIDTAGCTVLTTTQTVLLGSSQGDYEDEGGTLFAINPTGHSTTLIGSMTGGDLATEIEYDFLSGKLYATEVDGDPWLHTIDPSTGVSLDEVDIDGYDNVPGLEFVGSTLYGAMGTSPSHLVTINPVTGAVTDIGSTGIYEPLSGLAYDASTSTMYGVTAGGDYAHLVTIDVTTGWATEVGYIEVYGYYVERVGSIEFGPDGKLYGGFTWNAYPYWLDLDYHLIEIDPATGEATDLFDTGFSITGLTLAEITVPVGLECSLGDLGPGETSAFSIWARVRPDTLGVISNRVDVLSDTEDPNPNNDWDTEASLVLGKADLKVTKFGKPDGVVRAGEELEYTVIVDNLGTGYAHDVVLYDEITASGWEWEIDDWDSNRPASCSETYDYYEESTTLTCRLLDPLEVMTPSSPGRWILKVWVDVYERMSINNVARVVATDFDPDLSNNEAIVEHEITAVADLELDKEAYGEVLVDCEGVTDFWEDEVAAGGLLYYYLDIYNDGPSEAENVVVEDWGLSPYLDIIDVECVKEDEWEECSCVTTELGELGDENRRLECNLGTMEEDDEDEIIITARIPSDVPEGIDLLKNDARVYSDVFDDDNGDNLVTNWTTVSRWADLAVEKTQGPEIALPGMDITYSITVTNLGLSDVEGVFISDTVPVQVLNPTWTCCASDDGECDVPCEPPTCPVEPCPWPDIGLYAQADIPAGEWVIYTVEGTLDWWPCGPFTNTVEVIPPQNLAHPETDVDPCDENNTDIAVNDPVCHFDPLVLKTFPGADSTP